jgi:TP901-1 family phage major tail protein
MAAQAGKDVLIELDDSGGSTFVAVGGLRSTSISLNASSIDVTNADSTGRWRELLAESGIKSAGLSGSGVFVDSAGEEDVRGLFFQEATNGAFRFTIPDFGTITGAFKVTGLEYAGEHDGEATYSMSFESAGALTWAAT